MQNMQTVCKKRNQPEIFRFRLVLVRQKGLGELWFGSVEPSPAVLIRTAFDSSSPFFTKTDPVDYHPLGRFWYARRDSNPRPPP